MKFRTLFSICFLIFFTIFIHSSVAQSLYDETVEDDPKEKFDIYSISVGLGQEYPGGDLKDRYGDNMKFSLGGQYFTNNNYLFEIDFNLMFGNKVKEDVLVNLRNPNGFIISQNGGLTDVFLRQRGMFLGGVFGKVFSFNNTQNGIRLSAGAGILSHSIRVVDETDGVPQVTGEYLKGYDRLTRGFALKQQLGYEIHSNNGRINMNILFEVTQAFTKNIRTYQFDIGKVNEGKRLDLLYSIRFNWMLPLKRVSTIEKAIYY